MKKILSSRRDKKNFFMLRLVAATVLTGVFLVCVLSAGNSLAQTWAEPAGPPPTNNARPPIWNQTSTAQAGGLYVNGKGRFDTTGTGDAICTNSKVCGADNAGVAGLVGESNTGYGVYASSISNYGLVASSVTNYAGYFSGSVYVTGGINVNGKYVCLSDGTNCAASGGYWAASGNNINSTNSGNVGIGTTSPNAKLTVGAAMGGTTLGTTFITNSGSLGSTAGNTLTLANIGFLSGNNTSLAVRAYRRAVGGDWTTGSIILSYDVDNVVNAGAFISLSGNGNVGVGTSSPAYKLDVNGSMNASGNITQNGTKVCLADGTNCPPKTVIYGTQPTALLWGSECSITYNNGDGRLLGLPLEITATRTGKVKVTINAILRHSSASADTTTVKLMRTPQAYGCTTGAQTSTPVASGKGIYTLNSSDRRAFETFAVYDVIAGSAYSFDLAVFNSSGTTIRFSAIEYAIEEL